MVQRQYDDLKKALKLSVMSEETLSHKERVVSEVHTMRLMQKKRERTGFFTFMLRQIPFMGRELWMMHGGIAAAMFGILYLTVNGDLNYLDIRHIPLLLGIAAIVLVMASVPLLLRPYRYRMYEIELASRISLPGLLLAELAVLAAEYIAVLLFCTGLSSGMAGLHIVSAVLYFLLPLSAAGMGCVQIMRRTGGWNEVSHRLILCEGYCVCLGTAFILLYCMKRAVYGDLRLWGALAACTTFLLALSVRTWVKESAEADTGNGMETSVYLP